MTVDEFKISNPGPAHLEGDDLWDAMTEQLLHQQGGEEILKTILPFWKRYKLRYLFYKKPPYVIFTKEWQSNKMCRNCKKGSNSSMLFMRKQWCIYCQAELVEVKNTNLKYLAWHHMRSIVKAFWSILEAIHLIRSKETRYGIFGDESSYVQWSMNFETGKTTIIHKPRRWFEYIFIKR